MALLPGFRTSIVLDLSDRVVGDTRLKQRARFLELHHTQSPAGECGATILLEVSMYAASADGYGPELVGAGFARRPVRLSADNDTLVEVATGQILAIRQGESEEAWQQHLAALSQERDTMLQGDFFEHLRDNGLPGTIRQMIEQHIQQADAFGRFA